MYGDDAWNEMGGGWAPIQVADYATLVSEYPPASQDVDALAVITSGEEQGAWYEINAAGDGWQGRTIWKDPA